MTDLRVFGGVAAFGPAGEVDLGGPKQRAVLALLVVRPGAVVSLDRIVEALWNGSPPGRAEVSVRGYVSNLRKALASSSPTGDGVIQFRDRGYVLEVAPDDIDVHRFEAGVSEGTMSAAAGRLSEARRALTDALALWTGPPFGSLADDLGLEAVTARLEQRRGEAVETLAQVRLALGEHVPLAADLVAEMVTYPYREQLRVVHATALYRSGRAVDALRSIDDARRVLADDVGVEPGPELRDLETAILVHDPVLTAPPEAVTQRLGADERTSTPAGPAPALFGRDEERAVLRSTLERLPVGGCVVVSGEAGIGKTTLVTALRVEAEQRGIAVGWGRCSESAADAPYRSWLSAIDRLAVPAAVAPTIDDASDEASVEAPDREPDGGDATAVRLAAQVRVLDGLRSLMAPVVVVIDDLQWADDATLKLLEFLAPEIEDLPVLLAVTVRRAPPGALAGPVRDCLAELSRSTGCRQLVLEGLDRASVGEWAGAEVGGPAGDAMTAFLAETTEGNPFFLRELMALLAAEGRLAPGAAAPVGVAVPVAVQDVIRRRTSRLAPDTQALLTAAAVIGRRFDVNVLAAVVELDVLAVLERLEGALDDGLVTAEGSMPGRFAFSHSLVVETLVAEQNAAALARLHARITVAIEELRAGRLDEWLGALVHHATAGAAAGTGPRAVGYCIRAADVAEAAKASGDVAAHLEQALAMLAFGGDDPPARRIDLLTRLGVARRDTGDLGGGRAALVDAAVLAEAVGDDAAVATALAALSADDLWAGLDWSEYDQRVVALIERILDRSSAAPTAVTAQVTAALAAELVYLDPPRADVLSVGAVVAADQAGDAVVSARTLLQRYWVISGSSHNAERARVADRLVELVEAGSLPRRFTPLAHLSRVSPAYELGDMELVGACLTRARESAHPVHTPTGWAHLLYLESSLAMLAGDLDRAALVAGSVGEAMARVRSFAAATTRAGLVTVIRVEQGRTDDALGALSVIEGSPYGESARWLKAWVLAEGGRVEEAGVELAAFDGVLADDWYRIPLTVAGVLAASRVGDTSFVRRHLGDLTPAADRFACVGSGGMVLGPVAHALAAGHLALGEREEASRHAAAAASMIERMGAVCWQRRNDELLAHLA